MKNVEHMFLLIVGTNNVIQIMIHFLIQALIK